MECNYCHKPIRDGLTYCNGTCRYSQQLIRQRGEYKRRLEAGIKVGPPNKGDFTCPKCRKHHHYSRHSNPGKWQYCERCVFKFDRFGWPCGTEIESRVAW